MNYNDWLTGVPETIRTDPLWKVEAYRLAMFAADVGWEDVTKLVIPNHRTSTLREDSPTYLADDGDLPSNLPSILATPVPFA